MLAGRIEDALESAALKSVRGKVKFHFHVAAISSRLQEALRQ